MRLSVNLMKTSSHHQEWVSLTVCCVSPCCYPLTTGVSVRTVPLGKLLGLQRRQLVETLAVSAAEEQLLKHSRSSQNTRVTPTSSYCAAQHFVCPAKGPICASLPQKWHFLSLLLRSRQMSMEVCQNNTEIMFLYSKVKYPLQPTESSNLLSC